LLHWVSTKTLSPVQSLFGCTKVNGVTSEDDYT
jgi:hypothetical protein